MCSRKSLSHLKVMNKKFKKKLNFSIVFPFKMISSYIVAISGFWFGRKKIFLDYVETIPGYTHFMRQCIPPKITLYLPMSYTELNKCNLKQVQTTLVPTSMYTYLYAYTLCAHV